jgi:hypothetical protein
LRDLGIIKLPYRGAPTTVSAIRTAALQAQEHYLVRQLAERICGDLRPKDYVSEALANFHFLIRNTRYMRDPRTIELVRAPWVAAEEIFEGRTPQLDCDDLVALLTALNLMTGAQSRVVTVAFQHLFHKGTRQYTHVFSQVREPRTGAFLTLDLVTPYNTKAMLGRAVAFKIWPVA